jgi:uncharacterized protein DUF488
VRLATSYYAAGERIRHSGMLGVGISVGKPPWPLPYPHTFLDSAAPYGLLQVADQETFEARYVERLDRIGVDHFRDEFSVIATEHDAQGLALLCFEKAGEECHRRLWAYWWERQTGEHVPELAAEQLELA